MGKSDTLFVNILNVGIVPSYIGSIQFKVIDNERVKICNVADFPSQFYEHHSHYLPHVEERRSHYGKPLQPGQGRSYPYHLGEVCDAIYSLESQTFFDEVQVIDEIGNIYSESVSPEQRSYLQTYKALYYDGGPLLS